MAEWASAGPLDALAKKGRRVLKAGSKQIALFHGAKGVFACNNRCPHEGYPLVEGSLAGGCVLTCNWHNWKFDLESGETLIGEDALQRYPVEIRDGEVFVDVSGPPPEVRRTSALKGLQDGFRRDARDRLAREIARLEAAGGDPLDAVRMALDWAHDRLEFGTTHAIAAAPDWLSLRERHAREDAERLAAVTEIVGHLNWDSLREPHYPYPEGESDFDADALVEAIEAEDEATAVRLVRGALRSGVALQTVLEALGRAALAHYADFGHSAIYVLKTGELLDRLGAAAAEPLLLALTRSLVTNTREDLIPEFRDYAGALAAWDGTGDAPVVAEDFDGLGVRAALARCVASSGQEHALYDALLGAAARQWLHFDLSIQDRTDNPVSQNINWLDFTHAVTFANAVRHLCDRQPELWPQGLLQMACFVGRNAPFVEDDPEDAAWAVEDPQAFLRSSYAGLFDHAQPEFIVSSHLIKILTAVEDELDTAPEAPWRADLLAAVNRFLHSPLKRRHALRAARQALDFVAREG
ncbi:MAG: Rieske 2Fe-2S domain-containing protein [Alphaproteobacteria bacterium]|nr:Rieske 2Fe-2S domain-containing protein [Alphaproteobacteria bacterium]